MIHKYVSIKYLYNTKSILVFFVMAVFDWHSDVVLKVPTALHLYITPLQEKNNQVHGKITDYTIWFFRECYTILSTKYVQPILHCSITSGHCQAERFQSWLWYPCIMVGIMHPPPPGLNRVKIAAKTWLRQIPSIHLCSAGPVCGWCMSLKEDGPLFM